MSPDYGIKVSEDFQEYLKTGENHLIEKYSARELKMAISLLSPYYNTNKQWYREIERRIERAQEEIKMAQEYDGTVINLDLDQTIHEIEEMISEFEKKLKGGK